MSTAISEQIGRFNTGSTKIDVVAIEMSTNKSTVSKFQKKRVGDVNINKLKRYVEAIGGEFSIQIKLPNGDVVNV